MTIPVFDIGDAIRLEARFTDPDMGIGVDPSSVTLRIKGEDGLVQVYQYPATITRVAQGVYRRVFDAQSPGMYVYRFDADGTAKASAEARFRVNQSEFF